MNMHKTHNMSTLRRCIAAFCAGVFLVSGVALAQSTMTDVQVLEYVQQGLAQGKTQQELTTELGLRGVTKEQAQRVYKLYQERQSKADTKTATPEKSRQHSVNKEGNPEYQQGQQGRLRQQQGQQGQLGEGEEFPLLTDVERETPEEEMKVYGRDIFRNRTMTFAPSENMATPRNYRLGPGDEVIIDVFGRNQTTFRGVISPEGSINHDVLGPVYLSGKTVEEANAYLKKRLSSIYGGLSGEDGTDMRLSLGQIRSIQINVMGDVESPGTYVLSGFATAFHAIYRAGGVKDPGTLRNIQVVRGNKTVAHVDVYEYMLKGTQKSDIRLEEGDVVLVGAYKEMVSVQGMVKRPMFFELKEGETVSDVLAYAGGFAIGANEESVTVLRQQGKKQEVNTVPSSEYGSFRLRNGDLIEVGIQQTRYENRAVIFGAVFLPGTYELSDVRTAKGLVQKAGGVMPEAFTDRVVVHREHPDKTMEVFSLNLTEILAGMSPDFVLQNNDELYVASKDELKDRGTMTISGMVNNPGDFPFAENTTIEDFIIMAGGLKDGASTSRVDVTRRKKDASGMVATSDIGEMYSFSLKDGLVADGDRGFVLEPYDEVMVHQSPSYNVQRHFTVVGEVNFPGEYSLTNREERVSDLIIKAGGLTSFAYIKGARLVREATEEEITQARELGQLLVKQIDSTAAVNNGRNTLKTGTRHYSIALDLEDAMLNPGGPSDVVLRENDRLEIPVRSNVVRVFGAVMYPTAVTWNSKMTVADYINAAGGYSQHARKTKKYLVSMGGRAKKVHAGSKVEPGSEIFVPDKEKKDGPKDYSGIIAVASAASSVATLGVTVVTLVNSFKKQ